ncbi:oxysterol-binding protein [Colletotrichum cuscutae]|uniref:Oxysterol-binding protein n=1 Tax=Colletotrichum cuscutae TaxID=1209917 RepID=A0AAI9U9H3_9PEZI|nr:oxysterol-binding protein [Colletotrichum cuscutae]
MSDAGDSEEDPSTTDDGAPLTSPPSTAASATNISMAQNVPRGNGANRLSISPSMGRTPSHNSPPSATASTSASKMSVAGSEKGVSLEQSVRKFRIVEALRSGDTASISKAIRDTAEGGPRTSISSINTLSGTGLDDTTVLHLAIQCAEYPVVEYVLSDGAGTIDINARDKDGNTPLHVAAVQGRTQVVKLLLDQKEINDAIANYQGRLPIDVARNPDIFQLLQLSRSIFAENKVRQIQGLIAQNDYKALETVLEESRLKQILDINSTEFVTEPTTLQAGGNLLHEAARKKNTQLIQVLLLHGADPFRRDRKGKLPQDVTKDDTTRAMLKRSPAAVAAQRGIQEKAVLGQAASQGAGAAASADPVAGKEAREMKGYLKKWTNYRKGYQLRWFVLEDGVLSYYKHQDDAGSACRGAINTRIAKLHMSADEKTKFEIIGKSSVKYTLKANHEVEAKRWFWALNNSIQWTKDQAKEEERQRARGAELLRQAKAEQSGKSPELSINEAQSESASVADGRSSVQIPRTMSHSKMSVPRSDFAGASTSAKLQLDTISAVNAAMLSEAFKNPNTIVSDTKVTQALTTYDAAVRSLTGLIGDLMRISKDRDAYWQYRLDREIDMRRMWEESMAKVAKEQEILEERVDQAEQKRKAAKRALREVMNEQPTATSQDLEGDRKVDGTATVEAAIGADDTNIAAPPAAPERTLTRKKTVLDSLELSDSESDDEDEFFDAVDAGEVEVSHLPHADAVPTPHEEKEEQQLVVSGGTDLSSSFKGYENGIRSRLKMDADDRPKISLWGILKSMIGKDMTKMTLPVSFNEPTSLLYRAGEDMEYVDLLDQAVERSDSIERLIYVAAFAASEYASTVGRVAKPFNPLLGETFEYVRPDKNYRFFIEQVSHHPPVGAAWAESPHWTYWGESAVKTKFYGKSFDANPLGTWFLKLRPKSGGKEDLYTWRKVTTSVIGIITGNPTVDNYGPMEVKNWTTGEVCQIEFQPRGWKASSAYKISGKVLDSDGRVRYSMGGRWNSKLYARLTPGYEATVEDPGDSASLHKGSITDPNKAFLIWQANPRPPGIPFNLTPFVLTFNHIDDKLKPWLPPTDSRLRPDQRAMEDGEYDFAAEEKNRLEEAQRARRKQREEKGIEFRPAWFEKTTCEITGEEYWKFNGKYWQQREKAGPEGDPQQAWEGLEPIYEDAK